MKPSIIMAVDPGVHSLAVAVLVGDRLAHAYQRETPRKDRIKEPDDGSKWLHMVTGFLAEVRPDVFAIEDFEPQTWRTGGKPPKGGAKMQALVRSMRHAAELQGIRCYTQSPGILAEYPDAAVDAFVRKYFGDKMDPVTPHLRSAVKHAWQAQATHNQARRAR